MKTKIVRASVVLILCVFWWGIWEWNMKHDGTVGLGGAVAEAFTSLVMLAFGSLIIGLAASLYFWMWKEYHGPRTTAEKE